MIGRIVLVVLAAVAAIAPVPSDLVERWYSRGVYARLQPVVTAASNLAPIALFDIAAVAVLVAGVAIAVRQFRRRGVRAAIRRAASGAIVAAAVLYLLFLAMWGLNYRRVPLERKLEYEAGRVTADAAFDFGAAAI